jgi:hypothetical protein
MPSRASSVAISASFWALVKAEELGGGFTHPLSQIRWPRATALSRTESIRRAVSVTNARPEQLQYLHVKTIESFVLFDSSRVLFDNAFFV